MISLLIINKFGLRHFLYLQKTSELFKCPLLNVSPCIYGWRSLRISHCAIHSMFSYIRVFFCTYFSWMLFSCLLSLRDPQFYFEKCQSPQRKSILSEQTLENIVNKMKTRSFLRLLKTLKIFSFTFSKWKLKYRDNVL